MSSQFIVFFFVVVLIALLYTQSKSMYRVIISNSLHLLLFLLQRPFSISLVLSSSRNSAKVAGYVYETISINTLKPCSYQMITESCLSLMIHSLNMYLRIFFSWMHWTLNRVSWSIGLDSSEVQQRKTCILKWLVRSLANAKVSTKVHSIRRFLFFSLTILSIYVPVRTVEPSSALLALLQMMEPHLNRNQKPCYLQTP